MYAGYLSLVGPDGLPMPFLGTVRATAAPHLSVFVKLGRQRARMT